MRGKDRVLCRKSRFLGITPAYAGKSNRFCETDPSVWDHPRVCGEKVSDLGTETIYDGSPPRMRGKVICLSIAQNSTGITPAYAGKSISHIFPPVNG